MSELNRAEDDVLIFPNSPGLCCRRSLRERERKKEREGRREKEREDGQNSSEVGKVLVLDSAFPRDRLIISEQKGKQNLPPQ